MSARVIVTQVVAAATIALAWAFAPAPAAVVGTVITGVVAAAVTVRLAHAAHGDTSADPADGARAELDARLRHLEAQADLRNTILGAMSEAVLLVDGASVTFANEPAQRMLGATVGRPVPPAIPGEIGTSSFEVHHPVHRLMRAHSVDLGAGTRVVFAQDVTDARRIEAIRRDFVANASHELKTPIAGILATSETLQGAIRDDPDAAMRFAETLVKEANRLSNLIQDLLDLARLEQPLEEGRATDWSDLVAVAIEQARGSAEARAISIDATIHPRITVAGRPEDLAQLARNLLDNAIAYTPDGGSVTVTLTSGDPARLTVADTGIGIPARELPRIFERFYRVDRARARHTGGTGLGLSIVRHIAEGHGGRVTVTSELGRGSSFVVELPAIG